MKNSKESKKAQTKHVSSATFSVALLLGSLIIAFAIIVNAILSYTKAQQPKATDPKKTYENIGYVKTNKSPKLGNKDAPLTIIEYTDFDCPICKIASDEILPKLKKEYIATNKVKFIFKSLPRESALRKTEAAFCAYELGGDNAFFGYYDSLFGAFNLSFSPDNHLIAIAQEQNLDTEQFQSCLNSKKYSALIKEEILEGHLIGSLGTPTWLIGRSSEDGLKDTIKVSGVLEYSAFQIIIDKMLAEKRRD